MVWKKKSSGRKQKEPTQTTGFCGPEVQLKLMYKKMLSNQSRNYLNNFMVDNVFFVLFMAEYLTFSLFLPLHCPTNSPSVIWQSQKAQ